MTDPLDRFTSALAERYDGRVAVPGVTRTRIVETVARRRVRRSGVWRTLFVVPLFALLGGTALAATGALPSTAEVREMLQAFLPGGEARSVAPRASVTRAATAQESATAVGSAGVGPAGVVPAPGETARVLEPSVAELEVVPARVARTAGAARPATSAASARAPVQKPAPEASSLGTYAAAQRAQFRSGDCSRAISLYEDYLAREPSGPLAVEARYNRSLCLLRLGRHEEARRALLAFANGTFGDYRRTEAAQLLAASAR